MIINKSKAHWLPSRNRFIRQMLISSKALITLPFFREIPNGIKLFFHINYNEKKDEYVFDGSDDSLYYDQIKKSIPIVYFNNKSIVDLGSGNGSLYKWFINNNISIKKYHGVDFAHPQIILSENAFVENISIKEYFARKIEESNVIYMMSNSLCYMSDFDIRSINSSFNVNDEIVIIDPSPNIFWDSHFNGIKPYYRKLSEIVSLLESRGWKLISSSVDYTFKIQNQHFLPISHCVHAIKMK